MFRHDKTLDQISTFCHANNLDRISMFQHAKSLIEFLRSRKLTLLICVPWEDQLLVIIVFTVYEQWLVTSRGYLLRVSGGMWLHSCIAQVDFKCDFDVVLFYYEDCVNQCCWYSVCCIVLSLLWLIYLSLSIIVVISYKYTVVVYWFCTCSYFCWV